MGKGKALGCMSGRMGHSMREVGGIIKCMVMGF
jgi:hypothetical protein